MKADELLQWITHVLFVLVFVAVSITAIQYRRRTHLNIALLFGFTTTVIAEARVVGVLGITPTPMLNAFNTSLVMTLPYLLLRLVDDFAGVSRPLMRLAEIGLALSVVGLFWFALPRPDWLTLLLVVYFVGFSLYSAAAFIRAARRSTGVTRRRLQAVAVGTIFLGFTILIAGIRPVLPEPADLWVLLANVFPLLSGAGFFLGFATPRWLRRAWQEPELRAFLSYTASLPQLPRMHDVIWELERGTAASVGAPRAAICLWDESKQVLRFPTGDPTFTLSPGQMIAGRVFASRQPSFFADAARDDPEYAEVYRSSQATAVLAAPISSGEGPLGVILVYASRPSIFAEDDLALLQLLANQAAVIVESKALIDEAALLKAREEAIRLKDDFLSAAAHDLKTPLTALLVQAQLLEIKAKRRPDAPADLEGIRRIIDGIRRLNSLVLELLDAAQVEHGRLLGQREKTDLVAIVKDVCARHASRRHSYVIETQEPVVGEYDRTRVTQLVENLIENAVKYSPDGGEVRVKVWREAGEARLSITDQGIGIPGDELTHIFDRFHRGANVDDRRFAGMGLGLYIARGTVEQHGGRIWATSTPGQGSTFHVALPLAFGDAQNDSDSHTETTESLPGRDDDPRSSGAGRASD